MRNKRCAMIGLMLAWVILQTGCVLVIGGRGYECSRCDRMVQIDGEWYVVDDETLRARKVEPNEHHDHNEH